jgi:hypothetical protein
MGYLQTPENGRECGEQKHGGDHDGGHVGKDQADVKRAPNHGHDGKEQDDSCQFEAPSAPNAGRAGSEVVSKCLKRLSVNVFLKWHKARPIFDTISQNMKCHGMDVPYIISRPDTQSILHVEP